MPGSGPQYDDQDDLSQFPSAVSPLAASGIDPEMAAADPSVIENAFGTGSSNRQTSYLGPNGAPPSVAPSAPPPAASRSAVVAGRMGGASPSTANDYALAGLGELDQNSALATQAASEIPTSNPEINDLTTRRSALATPAPLYDPQTGKMLSSTSVYDPTTGGTVAVNPKPSTGSRIWRGVRGGLVGLMTGGIPGAVVGAIEPQDIRGGTAYGAPNKQYQRGEEARQTALAATDAGLDAARQTWKQAVDAAKVKAGEFRANAQIGKDETTGATDLLKVPGEQEKADASVLAAQNNTPEAKARYESMTAMQRSLEADKLGLKGLERANYVAGKAVPIHEPNAELTRYEDAVRAFKKSHAGRAPSTPDEIREVNQSISPSNAEGANDTKGAMARLRAATTQLAAAVKIPPFGSAEQRKARQDAIDKAQREVDEANRELGGSAGEPAAVASGAPSSTGMVTMRAPDGSMQPVPAEQVAHYKSLGATVVP